MKEKDKGRNSSGKGATRRSAGAAEGLLAELESLRRSEAMYRSIVESSRDVIFMVDRDDVVRYVNPIAANMLGRAAESVVGASRTELFPEPIASRQKRSIERVLRTGKPVFVENSAGPPDVVRWHSTHLIPTRNDAGRVTGVLGIARDITERRQFELELQRVTDRLLAMDLIVDRGPFLLLRWQYEPGVWPLEFVSTNVKRILGYSAREMMAKRGSWPGIMHPDDLPGIEKEALDHMRSGRNEWSQEYRIFTRAGEIRWIQDWNHVLQKEGGVITHVQAIALDVTEMRRTERDLADIDATMRTIVNEASVGIALYEDTGLCALANDALAGLLGAPVERLRGGNFRTNDAWRESGLLAMAAKVLRSGRGQRSSLRFRTAAGKDVSMECFMGRIVIAGRRHLLVMATDTTERRRLEAAVMEIGERERRRMGRDLHDGLCQHLTGSAFALKVLEKELDGGPGAARVKEICRLVQDATEMAREVTSSLHPLSLQRDSLRDLLEDLCANLGRMYGVPCRLTTRGNLADLDLETATHLYRIAQEAANNGIRHGKTRRLDMRLDASSTHLTLRIRDEGRGMPRISANQSGMGLRIMQHRAELIGARFAIRSVRPRGTVVECRVPRPVAPSGA